MGGSGQQSSSSPTFQAFPGIFGSTDYSASSPIATRALNTLADNVPASTSDQSLQSLLQTTPSSLNLLGTQSLLPTDLTSKVQGMESNFGPSNPNEQSLLNTLMSQTGGASAASGLGPPTQTALATAIAPTLLNMQQNDISNLMTATGQDTSAKQMNIQNLLGAGQGNISNLISAAQQDITNLSQSQAEQFMENLQTASALQSLAENAMPQIAGGNTTNMTGSGFQLCCFIFIEAYDGKLLDVVRRYRDEHLTVRNRRGYYRVADVIVPWMRRSQIFKGAVKLLMTDPMVSYGHYHYGENGNGWLCYPIAVFWLKLFDMLGGNSPYVRKGGEVI